jgi:hypothetical protein
LTGGYKGYLLVTTETPIKKVVKPTKFFVSLKSLRYRLWDERNGKLVDYREARRGWLERDYAYS